jgi:DNA-binding transcriptional regulator YiaG
MSVVVHFIMDAMNGTEELIEVARARALARSGAARSIRKDAGVGLSEVARALGVEPSTVCRWETGERAPRGRSALAYVKLLDALQGRAR